MTSRPSIALLALLALGCAPSATPISLTAIDQAEMRYKLVLDPSSGQGSNSDAVARMSLAIERALAARGILRAAEWEEATLTVRFAMVDRVETSDVSPVSVNTADARAYDRGGDQNCNADHCSMAYWSPMMPAPVLVTARTGVLAIRMETTAGEREHWSVDHLEHNTWARVGQRRADEIVRELVRTLPATHES